MVSPVAELQTVVELILSQNPEGLSEHSLINLLQQEPHCFFDEQALRDSHTLFQTHFLLFHCLYRLQKQWAEARFAVLEISPPVEWSAIPQQYRRLAAQHHPDKPDHSWVTDITYIRTHEGWLYLAAVMDLFSRQIVTIPHLLKLSRVSVHF